MSRSARSETPRSAASAPSSLQLYAGVETPATPKPPSVTSMSSGEASSNSAAKAIACSRTARTAAATALPPSCSERDPPVAPAGRRARVRTRPAGAAARGHDRGVRLDVVDRLHRDTEPVGHDHREGRRMALPVGRGPRHDDHRPVRLDADAAELGPAEAGDLDISRHPDPELLRFAGLSAAALLRAEVVDVGYAQRLGE